MWSLCSVQTTSISVEPLYSSDQSYSSNKLRKAKGMNEGQVYYGADTPLCYWMPDIGLNFLLTLWPKLLRIPSFYSSDISRPHANILSPHQQI